MAAAAGLVWATLLMCVALGAGQLQRIIIKDSLIATFFPKGSLPPPVRIYCRQDAALNVGIDGDKVVLVNANCSDLTQKWLPVYILSSFSVNTKEELKPFFLINAETFQVITIPSWSGSGEMVGLSSPPANPFQVQGWLEDASKQLWTPTKPTRTDGFYKLLVTNNNGVSLNGLLGGVHVGTEVGIYLSSANSENAVWKLTSSSTTCFP